MLSEIELYLKIFLNGLWVRFNYNETYRKFMVNVRIKEKIVAAAGAQELRIDTVECA